MNKYLLTTTTLLISTNIAFAEINHSKHQQNHLDHSNHGYSPLNIMGSHSHSQKEWMFSYKFMRMEMDGMRSGTNSIDSSAVYSAGYMVSPLRMKTDMHMLSAMYGYNDRLTFMAMLPYISKSMDLRTMGGVEFTTKSRGIGDTKLSILDNMNNSENWSAMYSLSLPTGAIDKDDDTAMASNVRLGYPMQLGSGTVDFTPAIIYKKSCYGLDFGAKAYATFRINDNNEDYRLGNKFGLEAWAGKKINSSLSTGISLKATQESEISGNDSKLNANMAPTNDIANTGYKKVTLGIDLSYKPKSLKGFEFAIDYTAPAYQDIDGLQMDSDHMFTIAIRKTF